MNKFIELTDIGTYREATKILVRISHIVTIMQTLNNSSYIRLKDGKQHLITETAEQVKELLK